MPVHCIPPALKRNIFAHFVVFCAFSFLCGLGTWQYQRWIEKKALLTHEASSKQYAPLNNESLLQQHHTDLGFRQASLHGHTTPVQTFLLDNQIHNSQVGYDVLSLLYLNQDQAILVNRGWIPQGTHRQTLPTPKAMPEKIQITGTLRVPSKPAFIKQPFEDNHKSPIKRIQYIDFDKLEGLLDCELLHFVLIADKMPGITFAPKPLLQAWLTPERHLGYSMQWFALSLCLLIIYIVVLRKKG